MISFTKNNAESAKQRIVIGDVCLLNLKPSKRFERWPSTNVRIRIFKQSI